MSVKNLLITIIDTNPLWWGLQSSGLIKSDANNTANINLNANKSQSNFSFKDYLSAVVGFLNTYKTISQNNAVVLIAAHNTKADFLYPSKNKFIEKYTSPWDKYENISDMDDQIKENLKKLYKQTNETEKDLNSTETMISSAIGLGLCYINRIQKKFTFTETVSYRILVIKASEDSANQYMNFMNMIFSAEKLNVLIDSCLLIQDSSLLQQASNLTNGFYFKIPQISGLLNYLLWLFLPNESTRKQLVYPANSQVDYRAACFCHRKLIDVGYVCSVCLSVFCSFTPICSTCNCNFQFDINMLKKASSLKQGVFNFNKIQQMQQKQQSSQILTTSSIENKREDYAANSLATRFQDTSISSPAAPLSTISSSSNLEQLEVMDYNSSNSNLEPISQAQGIKAKLITVSTITSQTNKQKQTNLNDSLEMLE